MPPSIQRMRDIVARFADEYVQSYYLSYTKLWLRYQYHCIASVNSVIFRIWMYLDMSLARDFGIAQPP